MNEKVLSKRKNGMSAMLLIIFLYCLAIVGVIFGGMSLEKGGSAILFIVSMAWICLGCIPVLGLKVIGPQEALVLTLFGKYVGTLKEDGFYFVNPFCIAVNPAAKTKLSQSGDVKVAPKITSANNANASVEIVSKKISLKIMTLNNSRQKINDCLGNPVEIGIAVIWRVVDTEKAVFDVDNYNYKIT